MRHTFTQSRARRVLLFLPCFGVILAAATMSQSAPPERPSATAKTPPDAPAHDASANKASAPHREPIYNPKADAKAEIEAALKTAKAESKRVLIMFGGNWCGWCYKLHDVFRDDADVAQLIHNEYVLVLVDVDTHQKLLDHYVPDKEQDGYPFLTVLDCDGKVLKNQETGALEDGPKHDVKKVKAFLAKWASPARDAEKVLAEGLAQAKRESKRVLLHVGTPWCGWCHVLDRFLGQNSSLFDVDFVDVKIDLERMTNAEKVVGRLRTSDSGGVPWMAILDSDGKTLVTSDGPSGNIGYPAKPEEIRYFMYMLRTTIKRTTPDQLVAIEKKLQDAGTRILAAQQAREERTASKDAATPIDGESGPAILSRAHHGPGRRAGRRRTSRDVSQGRRARLHGKSQYRRLI